MIGSAATALDSIPVRVEISSGNIDPLLHEIRHALERLMREGTPTCIDLKGIPLAPGEEEKLLALLGTGEVRAELNAAGTSEIVETSFPGVWLASHFGEQGGLLARLIEVTFIPEILRSQTADIADGLALLNQRLGST
jgi:hydrogenase-1 operon protein HyaF